MTKYTDKGGSCPHTSGVKAFEIGADYIDLRFKNGKTYRYLLSKIGNRMFGEMRSLCLYGDCLNTWLNKNRGVYDDGRIV